MLVEIILISITHCGRQILMALTLILLSYYVTVVTVEQLLLFGSPKVVAGGGDDRDYVYWQTGSYKLNSGSDIFATPAGLAVQNDGNLVIYARDPNDYNSIYAAWATFTDGPTRNEDNWSWGFRGFGLVSSYNGRLGGAYYDSHYLPGGATNIYERDQSLPPAYL
jgi:hypothetical protein